MRTLRVVVASLAAALIFTAAPLDAQAPPAQAAKPQQSDPAAVAIDGDDIGGVVTSRFGPEAGVWVVAETRDLGTRFAKR